MGFKAGDTNLFRYVGNSPTNGTDPTGFFTSGNHEFITTQGLIWTGLSKDAIDRIVKANVNQDNGLVTNSGPFADPLNHGDKDKIAETIQRIEDRYALLRAAKTPEEAMELFGKILHGIQDLYAHTTYIEEMDRKCNGRSKVGTIPVWQMTDGTGRPYVPKGVIAGGYKWWRDNAPPPSHLQINKDSRDPTLSPRGNARNFIGTQYYDLAEDVSIRATEQAWQRFLESVAPDVRTKIENEYMTKKPKI